MKTERSQPGGCRSCKGRDRGGAEEDCGGLRWTEVGGGDERGEVEWSWGRRRAGGTRRKKMKGKKRREGGKIKCGQSKMYLYR